MTGAEFLSSAPSSGDSEIMITEETGCGHWRYMIRDKKYLFRRSDDDGVWVFADWSLANFLTAEFFPQADAIPNGIRWDFAHAVHKGDYREGIRMVVERILPIIQSGKQVEYRVRQATFSEKELLDMFYIFDIHGKIVTQREGL